MLSFVQAKAEKDELMSVIHDMKEDTETLNNKFVQQQDDEQRDSQALEEFQAQLDKLLNELETEKNK